MSEVFVDVVTSVTSVDFPPCSTPIVGRLLLLLLLLLLWLSVHQHAPHSCPHEHGYRGASPVGGKLCANWQLVYQVAPVAGTANGGGEAWVSPLSE